MAAQSHVFRVISNKVYVPDVIWPAPCMAPEIRQRVAAKPTHFRALSCAGCARGLSCESVRPAYERESDRLWGRLYEAFGASRRRQAAHGTTSTSPSSKLIFTLSLLLLTAPTRPGYIWRFFHGAMTRMPINGSGISSAGPTAQSFQVTPSRWSPSSNFMDTLSPSTDVTWPG